jgi:hypothetical protein
LSVDARYGQDTEIGRLRRVANELLDHYLDVEWLAWGEPVGLMPRTQEKAKGAAEAAARRQAAAEERRKLKDDRRREEERKKREAGTKAAGGSARPVRGGLGRKASQASGLGGDIEMSGSESGTGAGKPAHALTKSEAALYEARTVWKSVQSGRPPAGYVLVSHHSLVPFRAR